MRHVQFTVDDDDHARLVALAKFKRQSIANFFRRLIARKYEWYFGDASPQGDPVPLPNPNRTNR